MHTDAASDRKRIDCFFSMLAARADNRRELLALARRRACLVPHR
jgi:hypothetical protein